MVDRYIPADWLDVIEQYDHNIFHLGQVSATSN